MSTSPVLTSLKLAMIAKIREKATLTEDTVSNLGLAIYHMQTLSQAMLFISRNALAIDTTNLQEDFDAEQRAAVTSSFLPSMGPTAIASHRRLDEKAVGDLRVVSWEVPAYKTEMTSFIPVQIKDETASDALRDMSSKNSVLTNEMGGEGAARVTTSCPDILSGGPTAIGAPSKLDVTADAVIVIIHPAAADPLLDPPDPLSGDTVDAAPMVAPTTDAATMAMPCARHDVSPVGPTPPPDPFLKGFLRDANPGLSPWPCCSVPRSICPAAPNYAEKPDFFARQLRSCRGI